MVTLYNEHIDYLEGGHFSTFRKNLGNKLFIYAVSRIVADKLNCNLILPEESYIRRELFTLGYQIEKFPFNSITDRKNIEGSIKTLDDPDLFTYKSIDAFLENHPNRPIEIVGYFTKYEYIKPYKDIIKSYYTNITKPKRNSNDMVIMLRDSTHDSRFVLPDDYYINIIENETFDSLYVCYDHFNRHLSLINKLKKYNPIYLEGGIMALFSEMTSFNKIIASQGTFSFWAAFLSNAERIYWPFPDDGPNSNNEKFVGGVNLLVDDDERYTIVNLKTL